MTPMLRVLGPIELDGTTGPVRLGGPKQQAVLALLVAARGQVVSRSTVIMGVWGEDASDDRQRSFHTYVSNLRSLLGAPIERRGDGYRIDPASVRADAWEFEDAVERCRTELAATPAESAEQLREALGWWRGLPYLEASEAEGLHAEISRLEDLRVDAVELRVDADLRLGRHEEVVTELDALVLEYPLRERLRTLQMLALYRSGRQAEALRAFERAREFFIEELGLDPSPELAGLQVRILNQDPTLMVDSAQTTTQRLAFLFTDIEGSSDLWELHPQDMAATLARHDEILSAAVADAGGRIFRDTGEGIGAAFPDVPSAGAAASQAQRSLSTETWHPLPAIRARMAVDVGDVDVRGDEYFGPPLNRCGRLLAAGHGGQVLLSGAAQDDLALASIEGTQIRQLGEHRLRGLSASERIGQLLIEGLPSEFPPLRLHVSGIDPTRRLDGDVLPGYELRNVIGGGTLGVVYRAFQPSVRREVALKVVRPEYAGHPAFIRRFEAEARLVASLQHPNIVPLFDYWRDAEGAYLVMQLMPGGSLAEALGKPWETNDAIRLLHQVAAAVGHGHGEGVVHGDLKPSNVLLDGSGNAYVGDFGIATRLLDPVDDGQLPPSAPAYRAPEDQATSAPDMGADIYSLGVMASELLNGRRPDATGDTGDGSLAEPVRAVLATASAALPEERYKTVAEFMAALDDALQITELANDLMLVRTDLRNPFKGLAAFGEADAREFFGREDLVDALVTAVEDHRLVTVVGPSGSGKSSLVRAGLVPRLRKNGVDGSGDWFITTLEPGSHPLDALAEAIGAIADTPVDDPVGLLEGGADSLVGLIGRSISVPGAEVLLLVDQFEELYTQSTETERATFVEVLTVALTEGAVRGVITVRADFFDRALSDPVLAQLVQAGLVPVLPLSKDELLAAIERPAAGAGVSIEPGLATRMADEVYGRTGALPLLQFALTRLFDEREADELTAADYEAMGGFAGAVGHQAERTYAELTVGQQRVAEGVLLRLVSIDEESDVTRRRVRRSELESLSLVADDVTAVIGRFDRARLLAFDRDPVSRGATVEIAHEAILTAWGRLGDLIDQHRESLLLTRRLRAAMVDWLEAAHADEYLLHGDRLARYRELDGTRTLSAGEQEFLRHSQEAEARAFRAAQRARRRRVAVAVVAGLLALVAVIIVTVSTLESRQASNVASMRALVMQALQEADSRPDVALLLAVEAYRRDPGPESQAGLLSALRQSTAAVVRTAGSHAGPAPNSFCGGRAEKPGRFLSTGTDEYGATEVVVHDVISGDVDRLPAPFSCAISELAGGRIIGTTAFDPFDSEGIHVIIAQSGEVVAELVRDLRRFLGELPDGRLLFEQAAEGVDTGTIVIVDPNSGEVARETGVQSLAADIDPKGRRALTQDLREGGAVRGILDLQTWEVSPFDPQLEAEGYWTPDGDEVVMPIGREVIRFDTDGAVIERSEIPGTSRIQSAPSFAPNGESFAVLTDAGVEFYSYPGFEPLAGPVEVPADVTSISSLDAQRVALLSPDGVVRIIGTDAGTPIERRVGFGRFNDTLFMVNPDYGQVWLAEGPSQPVRLATMEAIDLETLGLPEQAGQWPVGTDHWLNIEDVDGQFELQLYDATGVLQAELRAGDAETRLVLAGWDADAAHVALGMKPEDGLATNLQLIRFDAVAGTPKLGPVIDLDEHAQRPREGSAGFWILDLSGRTTIWSWEGAQLGSLDGLDDITLTALSPGGTRLASVEHDGTVGVWDVATGTRERDLAASSALEVPLFVDDERLLVRDWWGRVRLWDIESATELGVLSLAPDAMPIASMLGATGGYTPVLSSDSQSVWFSQDGEFIDVLVDPDAWVRAACDTAGRSLSQEEWKELVPGDEPYRDACAEARDD